jgi:hypothetical protein
VEVKALAMNLKLFLFTLFPVSTGVNEALLGHQRGLYHVLKLINRTFFVGPILL